MKKILFIAICCLFITSQAQAQLRFGVKGGVNLSEVSTNAPYVSEKSVTGFQIGPSIEWLFIKNLGIDAAVVYSQKGIKVENGSVVAKDNTGYIDIPVNLKMVIGLSDNFKPYIAAGPYISFKVSGDDTIGSTGSNISNQWKSESFGAGVNVGAGVELFHFVQVGANYGIGLTDDYKTLKNTSVDQYTAKSKIWSFTAAVYF